MNVKNHKLHSMAISSIILLLSVFQNAMASRINDTDAATADYQTKMEAPGPESLIATDLVGALMQIENLSPNKTTLFLNPPKDTFGTQLGQLLGMAGYKIQIAKDKQHPNIVEHFITKKNKGGNTIKTYQVNVGQVKVRRDYLISENAAKPQTTLYVKGADAAKITLNDDIFNLEYTEKYEDTENETALATEQPPELIIEANDKSQIYRVGDPIFLSVSINLDARVYCYYQDGHGQIARVYPNRFNTDNRVTANHSVSIPAADDWNINATRVGATDDFLCIATSPDNQELISVLDTEPDLEPLAARSLEQIYTQISQTSTTPVIAQQIRLTVE